ncbi:TraM recognition domain-containing protein [Clavibacter nebraskensis]|uniref:TraM recognition domain-containing protein n=1 Tax=Clavibacter nebraskensis TaxID=31963 RepID=A0ABY4MWB6_9MICO|nr:conjugal transfer protein [Clavibacter nebraskensis]OAH17856.1 conjugal transfer protein [Clavibacter nebraskensis]QGV67721.1 TraM recognition domain-containing protein [Clavibacter nebraskensis]QGV70521.1 TraM recognition domain-containing protein [Clavibacter nebraskensis]QGV73312.1 TraM recognition domain-containing protein [Clavibacter nebraskensis]
MIATWAIGIAAGLLASAWAGLAAAHALTGAGAALPADPLAVAIALKKGEVAWKPLAVVLAVAVAALLTALVVAVARALRRLGRGRTRVDRSARYLASVSDLDELRERTSLAKAARLGVPGRPGLPLGRDLRSGGMLYASWEDVVVGIAGPRVGKTTSLVVPAILAAPGALVTTSNKPDVVRATRDLRAGVGTAWVFDPQQVVDEEPTWWWDPLSSVTDDTSAAKLAGHFAAGSREADDRGDAFFDAAGKDLLTGLLLAAALDRRPITDVLGWLTDPDEREMVAILRRGGYPLIADDVESASRTSPRQRDGVYATARKMAACVRSSRINRWITPAGGDAAADPRPRLDPDAFVRSTDTLYSLSVEGEGTAAPLVTALTVAIVEAANVCRWKELPDLYSHLGSRGIPVLSIFQSYAQGVDVFGHEGMRKLFSAANEVVYLGGVKEAEWLRELSELIGDYDHETVSSSTTRGVRSASVQNDRRRILDTSELAELPRGRAVLLASGVRASMIATVPWMDGPEAAVIRASLAAADARAVSGPATATAPASGAAS